MIIESHYFLAEILLKEGDTSSALKILEKAQNMNPLSTKIRERIDSTKRNVELNDF